MAANEIWASFKVTNRQSWIEIEKGENIQPLFAKVVNLHLLGVTAEINKGVTNFVIACSICTVLAVFSISQVLYHLI